MNKPRMFYVDTQNKKSTYYKLINALENAGYNVFYLGTGLSLIWRQVVVYPRAKSVGGNNSIRKDRGKKYSLKEALKFLEKRKPQ